MKRRLLSFLGIAAWLLFVPAGLSQSKPEPGQAGSVAAALEDFKFTKIDLELLVKVKQFEKYLEEKGYVYHDAEVIAYVARVGGAVLPQETPEHVEWRFRVLRDPMANAFALPNGSIYVHTGLLALLENEAQLASVLAHEARHVLGHHTYKQNRSQRKKMVAIHILSAAGAAAGAAGGWGSVASAVISLIPVMVVGTIYGYSRELEREADVKAFTALNEAEYSTEEMPITFQLLQSSHEVELEGEPIFYRSHPRLQERIAYITQMVNTIRPKVRHPMVEAERYVAATEKTVRYNAGLDIQSGRARTALAASKRLVRTGPKAENFLALGDAIAALGPMTPEPTDEEKSSKGKGETRKMLSKMTPQEYEAALWAKPGAAKSWEENRTKAEEAYRKALELDANLATAYRGLGDVFTTDKRPGEAVEAYRKYLEMAPESRDRVQINRKIQELEKGLPKPGTSNANP